MSRLLRRFIVKYFGGTKNFILWTLAVVLTIYVIDSYILTRDRLESIVKGPKHANVKLPQAAVSADIKASVNAIPAQPVKPATQTASIKTKEKCGLIEKCPDGKYAYYIKSGEGKDKTPTICFDGNFAMTPELNNGHRGINMVIINDQTKKVEETRYFDTYSEDGAFVRFLKLGIKDNHIILATTLDEASNGLKEDSKIWMRKYGSTVIDKVKFRDAFAMIGQKGLTHGSAIEKFSDRGQAEFAPIIEISGCLSIPMGRLNKVEDVKVPGEEEKKPAPKEEVKTETLANCGIKEPCGEGMFSCHFFSGNKNTEGPKICVNGKYVLAKGLNDGGRGFNLAVVDHKKKDVIRVGHFDTYAEDSSNLEIFLEMVNDGDLVVGVTHDDASRNLNEHAKKLLQELGSANVGQIKFRDVWGFVGQKGISGFSTLEEVEFAGTNSAWPKPIDKRVCVPTKLTGTKVKPDPLANKNEKRRKFCSKNDGYGEFCDAQHIDEALKPAPLADKTLEKNPIFLVPVIVVPGLNHNAARMLLETLLMQPGINPQMVTIMYDEKFSEPSALAEVFGFKSHKLDSSTKYAQQMEKALEKVWELYPTAEHVIVLEEELILSVDFLSFMAQCLPVINKDDTLIGASAWNVNGYSGVSTLPEVAYRIEIFPSMAFLLKQSFYEKFMKNKMKDCCGTRSWDGWLNGHLVDMEMLVPDISRVYRRPYEGLSEQSDLLTQLFNQKRVTNLDPRVRLKNTEELTAAAYEESLEKLLKAGTALDTANVQDCLLGRGLGFYIPAAVGKTYVIYYEQDSSTDHTLLGLLSNCFKMFYMKGQHSRGLHKGMLRFSYNNNTMMIIGSSSSYYKYKPTTLKPVSKSHL